MKTKIATAVAAVLISSLAMSMAPASAKTVKECRAEWQAQKAAMQAAHKTEKAYIADCHPPAGVATPAATPASDKGDKGSNY